MNINFYVTTLNTFTISYNSQEPVNVSGILGKQLGNLLIIFLHYRQTPITKEELISILWQQSENPTSALKYSIHRFRKKLEEIAMFKGKEILITTKNGYQLNPAYTWDTDFDRLNYAWEKIRYEDVLTISTYNQAIQIYSLYKGKFVGYKSQILWMIQKSETYRQIYVKTVIKMCQYLIKQSRFDEMLQLNYNAILIEPFYEGLHYYYMKGLVATEDYHKALDYYDDLNEVFIRELGTGLSKRFKELYNVIVEDRNEGERESLENILVNLSQRTTKDSGFFCSYDMFKYIYELLVKISMREQKEYYLILINIMSDCKSSDLLENSNGVKKIIGSSLRSNDVFAKLNDGQFIILVDCQTLDNAYLIIQRISKKFYNRYRNKGLRMHYEVDVARFIE